MKKLVSFQALGLDPVPWSVPEICVTKTGQRFSKRRKKSDLAVGKASLADWQMLIRTAAEEAMAGISRPNGSLRLEITFMAKTPRASQIGMIWEVPLKWNEEKHKYTKTQPRGKPEPDLCNLVKAAEDAIAGIAFEDDVQTRSIDASMVYGWSAGVAITVYDLEP